MRLADAARHGELYPDRHLNVFVPLESHRLDLNVTRALVSALRWSRPDLTREFLREVAGLDDAAAPASGWQYDLGACDYEDFDPARCARQLVLGISREAGTASELPSLDDVNQDALRALCSAPLAPLALLEQVRTVLGRPELSFDALETLAHTLGELERGSLPDGWILAPQAGTCVLIEAKLMRWLDRYQLDRYAEVWFGRRLREGELVLTTWEAVARFFAQRRGDACPRTAFLCGQLGDYLDLLGLGAFHGFRPYDFDREALADALPKFQAFAGAVREQAIARGLNLGPVRPHPIGARLPFADAGLPGELALDLLGEGIRIELRLGDAPGGRQAGRAALDALLERSQDGERNPLAAGAPADLPALTVRIERHRGHDAQVAGWLEKETLNTAFDPAELGFVLSEVRRQHPPADAARDSTGATRAAVLCLGEQIDRHVAVGDGDGTPLLARVVQTLLALSHLARALAGPSAVSTAG